MPHFMIVSIPYINLLNISWTIKCLLLRNMEPLKLLKEFAIYSLFLVLLLLKGTAYGVRICNNYSFTRTRLRYDLAVILFEDSSHANNHCDF